MNVFAVYNLKGGVGKTAPLARLRRMLRSVRDEFDAVLLGCAPGIALTSEAVFKAVDALIVPTIPTPLSMRALEQVRERERLRQ